MNIKETKEKIQKTRVSKVKKYTFTLKNIDIGRVDSVYKFSIPSNIGVPHNHGPVTETTMITEILPLEKSTTLTYLDEAKNPCICLTTMVNINDNKVLPRNTAINCFWCRNSFKWIPIGCPVKYISNQINKKYISNITNDTYDIRENVSRKQLEMLGNKHTNPSLEVNECCSDHYETDGVFCSFNCCLAYIRDNTHNSMYDQCEMLLMNMHHEIFGTIRKIIPAPHWRLLREYGGTLSIDEFRESFNRVEYIKTTIRVSPLGMFFEKRCLL